jgi:hypothetical protein
MPIESLKLFTQMNKRSSLYFIIPLVDSFSNYAETLFLYKYSFQSLEYISDFQNRRITDRKVCSWFKHITAGTVQYQFRHLVNVFL